MFLSDQPATSLGGCATLWRGSVLRLHFILPVDAFSHLPGLKILGLNLHDSQLLPGVLWSLGQLQLLLFIGHHVDYHFLPPDA